MIPFEYEQVVAAADAETRAELLVDLLRDSSEDPAVAEYLFRRNGAEALELLTGLLWSLAIRQRTAGVVSPMAAA